jgi:hypothetical protein
MSEWTPDYKNLVVEECLKYRILPALLADSHKVSTAEMRFFLLEFSKKNYNFTHSKNMYFLIQVINQEQI